MNNTTKQAIPVWFDEYLNSFVASEAHGFIPYGDISGYAHESLSHRGFLLITLTSRRQVVVCYDRARGITFPDPNMREKALAFLGSGQSENPTQQADPFESALAGIGGPDQQDSYDPFAVRKPLDAL